jgi:hypothetical protein
MRIGIRDQEFFYLGYSGYGMGKIWIRDKHPGSATLFFTVDKSGILAASGEEFSLPHQSPEYSSVQVCAKKMITGMRLVVPLPK